MARLMVGAGFWLFAAGAACMCAGYAILFWQAWGSERRGEALRAIWQTRDYRDLHPRAASLIFLGGVSAAAGFISLLAGMFFYA